MRIRAQVERGSAGFSSFNPQYRARRVKSVKSASTENLATANGVRFCLLKISHLLFVAASPTHGTDPLKPGRPIGTTIYPKKTMKRGKMTTDNLSGEYT
ncbi:MAG: hypothetical protein GXP40_04055 [Chloroflexi bacterium]|nr:hypothetical protein [Chloroflexota bacterium]